MTAPPRTGGAGRALWWRIVGAELGRGRARAATLAAGTALASAAFAILSVGVVQQRLPAGALQVDWSDGATIVATPPDGRATISRHELAVSAASPNVKWAAPITVVGMTAASPGRPEAGSPAETMRPAPAGLLIIGIDPLRQDYATGLAESLTGGVYLKDFDTRQSVWPVPAIAASLDGGATARGLLDPDADNRAATGPGARARPSSAGTAASPFTIGVAGRPVDVIGVVDAPALTELLAPVAAGVRGLGYDGAVIMSARDAQRFAGTAVALRQPSPAAMIVQASGRIGTVVYAERVRVAAEAILLNTGLTVSIDGHPLSLAATVDVKSAALMLILLLVAAAFVANATAAALNVRRRELDTLATLGWSRARIVTLIVTENALAGLAAGGLAVVLSLALLPITGARDGWQSALWAFPAAMILSVAGSAVPTWLAASGIAHHRASRRFRSVAGASSARALPALAVKNVRRFGVRSAVGAAAIGVSTGVLIILCVVSWEFGNAVVGSLLGLPLAVQIGPLDLPAACTLVLLSCLILADVVALNLRDRRRELATLAALGWLPGRILGLVLAEVAIIAGSGVLAGATIATALCSAFLADGPGLVVGQRVVGNALVGDAAGIAAATIVVTLVLAVAPVAALRTGFRALIDQS